MLYVDHVVGSHADDKMALDWDSPQRLVSLPKFELGSPVTLDQWSRFVVETGYHPQKAEGYLEYVFRRSEPERKVCGSLPVGCVSLDDAAAYCRWLKCRLPTEFELEVAMRDGYRIGTWLWTCDPWVPDRLKRDDLGDGYVSPFGDLLYAVRGCGVEARGRVRLRYPYKVDPARRSFRERSFRDAGLGFCVCYVKDTAIDEWKVDSEAILFEGE